MKLAVATAVSTLLVVLGAEPPATAAPNVSPKASQGTKKVLPFIEDDYPAALAEARAKKLPLFIEAWAPW